jgi:hypothetical protein
MSHFFYVFARPILLAFAGFSCLSFLHRALPGRFRSQGDDFFVQLGVLFNTASGG